MRKSITILFFITITAVIVPVVNYYMITFLTEDRIFNSFAHLPDYHTVLVLGSGRNYEGERPNYSFINRMDATQRIGKEERIQQIILSGRNIPPHYNETHSMTEALKGHVELSKLQIDSNGINTFTSLVNYYNSNKKKPLILISEKAHLERALFYSDHIGIDAVGYCNTDYGSNINIREVFARMKASMEMLIY